MVAVQFEFTDLTKDELHQEFEQVPDLQYDETLANVDPATAAIVIGTTAAVAKLILKVYETARGGTVIDFAQSPPKVRRDRSVPINTFILLPSDGLASNAEIIVKDEPEDSLERIIKKLMDLPAATAAAITDLLESERGGG